MHSAPLETRYKNHCLYLASSATVYFLKGRDELETKMNILHISDMHFGPRHWLGKSELLLEKLNSYAIDIVINTGDNTTDSLENEFEAAGEFFKIN